VDAQKGIGKSRRWSTTAPTTDPIHLLHVAQCDDGVVRLQNMAKRNTGLYDINSGWKHDDKKNERKS